LPSANSYKLLRVRNVTLRSDTNFVAFVSKPKVEAASQQSKFTKTKLITNTHTLNREP